MILQQNLPITPRMSDLGKTQEFWDAVCKVPNLVRKLDGLADRLHKTLNTISKNDSSVELDLELLENIKETINQCVEPFNEVISANHMPDKLLYPIDDSTNITEMSETISAMLLFLEIIDMEAGSILLDNEKPEETLTQCAQYLIQSAEQTPITELHDRGASIPNEEFITGQEKVLTKIVGALKKARLEELEKVDIAPEIAQNNFKPITLSREDLQALQSKAFLSGVLVTVALTLGLITLRPHEQQSVPENLQEPPPNTRIDSNLDIERQRLDEPPSASQDHSLK